MLGNKITKFIGNSAQQTKYFLNLWKLVKYEKWLRTYNVDKFYGRQRNMWFYYHIDAKMWYIQQMFARISEFSFDRFSTFHRFIHIICIRHVFSNALKLWLITRTRLSTLNVEYFHEQEFFCRQHLFRSRIKSTRITISLKEMVFYLGFSQLAVFSNTSTVNFE